jgi:cell division protein ZipA
MPELRIILLVAGILFVAGIAGFEWWRARRDRPLSTLPRDDSHDAPVSRGAAALPEIGMAREPRSSVPDMLPVIELRKAEQAGARDSGGIAVSQDVAVDEPFENTSTQAIFRAHDEPYIGQEDEVSASRVVDWDNPAVPGGPKLLLVWPGESERRIVTLRVIPRTEPRFSGRSLRQAFGSAGFWHGPLEIYHLPDGEGRVIVSAAALAQPGTFDPSIMDSQRFSGLNLFAVLPGPLPEREAFDELVHAARALAERLDAKMTDQHGEELTAPRIARLRQSLDSSPAARASGES